MEELQAEELEYLMQELEEESEEEDALSPEVEKLLRDLQSSSTSTRLEATNQLGALDASSSRIVDALMAAQESDDNSTVRWYAADALRAPVHQSVLEQHPDLERRAQSVIEQAVTQSEKVRSRKEPMIRWWSFAFIAFGIVWVVISGKATSGTLEHLLLALPGVGVVVFGLWKWLSAMVHRNVLSRSMKETVGTIQALRKSVSDSDYGSTTTYHVTVRFDAEDAKMGTRVMVLKAQVARHVWMCMVEGRTVSIRYATEDPRVALIEGEW